jgi:glycosyltransferase involved in cell wall biosynthesis
MPTYNRRAMVPLAVDYFLRQDYPHKELIIVDDGSDRVGDLVPDDGRFRYIRLAERGTVGSKRNVACEQARGEIIAHWDDDDWHAPHRLRYQVTALLETNADVCGINRLLFYDARSRQAWRYDYPPTEPFWLSGSTLCYRRSYWAQHLFADINVGEDAYFVWSGSPQRMTALSDSTFHIGMIHDANVSPKQTYQPRWQPYPAEELERLMGMDAPARE